MLSTSVPDVYTWQALGPAHLQQLEREEATPWIGDLLEVEFGPWTRELVDPHAGDVMSVKLRGGTPRGDSGHATTAMCADLSRPIAHRPR